MIVILFLSLFVTFNCVTCDLQEHSSAVDIFSQTIICNRNDTTSQRNECIKENMVKLIPALKNGYAPSEIPSLDPLSINMAEIHVSSPALSLRVKIKDTVIHGFTSTVVKNVRSKVKDDEKMYILIDIFIPQISATASYKGQVNFNQLKFNPNGNMNVTISGINVTLKLLGIIVEEHVNIKTFDAGNINLTDFKSYFSGLLPDPEINSVIVELINQGWRDIYDPFVTGTKTSWSPIFLDIFHKAFKHFSFK